MSFIDITVLNDRELLEHIAETLHRIENTMATQADVDALTTALTSDTSELGTALTAISDQIASLQAANPGVDLSGLQTAAANLGTAVTNIAALVPAAPSAPVVSAPSDVVVP
jgi:hypothetical protein